MNKKSTSRIEELREKFSTGFYTFWVRQYRISYLIVLTILIIGLVAAYKIPKESSPSIKLGIISITTSYFGASPIDMDSLVTDKIYKEVKDIKGVDKIQSASALGFSSVTLTLKTSADVKDVISDVRSAVGRVVLPADAKTPTITEIETDTNRSFSVYLYSHDPDASKSLLFDRLVTLQKAVEKVPGVNTVVLAAGGAGGPVDSAGGNDASYEVHITVPEAKLSALGLSLSSIASLIQGYNRDQPIGNFTIGDKKYDFRIEGKKRESFEFLTVPIALPKGGSITLGELASIERKYKSDAEKILVLGGASSGVVLEKCPTGIPSLSGEIRTSCKSSTALPYVSMTVNKVDNSNIFSVSDNAKAMIDEVLEKSEFKGFDKVYAIDLADTIRDDYAALANEATSTILLVFAVMFLFVGFRAALFATLTLPLAFLSTFILLYYGGYTMNFLTNFSLILAFGTTVDTIIVLVQSADAKIRAGYDPRTAIMLSLREFAAPIISGALTTIIVFVPLMTLPGVLGKFLAYIPITNFGVQATGLVLALTVNSALYLLFVRRGTYYIEDPHAIEYASDEEKELLALEREGKSPHSLTTVSRRIKVISWITERYKNVLSLFLGNTFLRRVSIFVPVALFFLSFIFLAPRVGFELFPGDDEGYASFVVTGPVGQKTEVTKKALEGIHEIFVGHPEIKYTSISINDNQTNIAVQLTKRDIRRELGQRDVFTLEKLLLERLQIYEQKGYKVASEVLQNGPPGSKALGLKLIVDDPEKLPVLIQVAKDFEAHLKTIPGTKNAGRSSVDTPGQFIFTLDKELIATTGITPGMIYGQILQNMNGVNIGSIEDNGEDMSIFLKSDQFDEDVKIEDILSIQIIVGTSTYRLGDFVDADITNATASISREDGDILITVDADLEQGVDTVSTQLAYAKYAENYPFPQGVTYKSGGENEENSELIVAVLSAFFLSLVAIFAILTFQFQSYSQPLVILYSVIMALPFVMVGLLITGNQFSMPFGIGFIAFTGIGVNHGVVLISAINENLKKGMQGITALVEAGSSRLEPVILTTLTTIVGTLPISLRDKFWSGLGFTIIFGIIATTFLTLFIVKGIYYELYLNPEEGLFRKCIRKIRNIFTRKRVKKIKKTEEHVDEKAA